MTLKAIVVLLAAASVGSFVLPQAAALRVCADPDYLPYSNQSGEGFENKIAEAVAKALGEPLEYTWASTRGQGGFSEFLARTLDANKCDVVMNIPYGNREELTTQPYYVSSYVFVFKKSKNYDIRSMDSEILKQVKTGFESDTPAENGLKMRGMLQQAVAFDVGSSSGESPVTMLNALQNGQIDIAVPNERALGAPEQYAFPMSMGVRQGNESLQKRLDAVIGQHQSELTSILSEHGVRLYTPQ